MSSLGIETIIFFVQTPALILVTGWMFAFMWNWFVYKTLSPEEITLSTGVGLVAITSMLGIFIPTPMTVCFAFLCFMVGLSVRIYGVVFHG